MQELWQPAFGWEDHYEVSNLSRCRSIGRWLQRKSKSRELYSYFRKGSVLTPKHEDHGNGTIYLRVSLCVNGKKTYRQLHKLMWESFNGPVPEGMCVLHGPTQGKERHYLSNLSLGTHADNMGRDRLRDGTDNGGSRHYLAKLSEEAVEIIRTFPAGYGTGRALAKRFGVSESAISNVRACKTWSRS